MVDPYDWLDIPKVHRPPTQYQLLGLSPRVQSADEIRSAADRQLRRVQPHLTGPHGSIARILRAELVQARDTLLDPGRRAVYDTLSPDAELEPVETPAPEPTAADEEAPAPDPEHESAAGPEWWKETGPVDDDAEEQAPWWQEAVPDESSPPAAAPPSAPPPAPIRTGRLEPARPRSAPAPPPRKPKPAPPPVEPVIARPVVKKRGLPTAALVGGGILVTALIAAGAYFGFIRNKGTEPGGEPKGLTQSSVVQPRPPVEPEIKEDDPIPDPPAPADFVEKLRPKVFKGHQATVSQVAAAKTGQRFVSVGTDQTVRIWSVDKDTPTTRHKFRSPGVGVAIYAKDSMIAACDGLTVALLDANRQRAPKVLESPRGGVSSLAVTADGAKILTGLSDGYLRLWDTARGNFDEWGVAPRGPIAVAISPDGTKALAAVLEGPVSLWDLRSRKSLHEWSPHRGGAIAVSFSPDGTRAALAGADSTASVFDLVNKKEICRMNGHSGPLAGIGWLSDGRQVVTAGIDETARLWNAETGQPRRWVQTLTARASCLAVDPLDRFVLVGTTEGPIQLIPLPRVRSESLAGPASKPPGDPLPIPDPEAVEAAIAKVRQELAKDFTYERPDDVGLLADNLRRRAGVEGVPPPLRYGLLREATKLAVKAADPVTVVGAAEDLAAWFEVDELAEKAVALAAIPAEADPLVLIPLAVLAAERGESDARPEVVARILKRLPAEPPAGLQEDQKTRLTLVRQRFTALAAERDAVRKAVTILKNAPDDQGSNHTLGVFLCLTRQDWSNGLQYLVKGADPKLIEAAKADLGTPSDPKAQHRVGELWYALAVDAKDQRHRRSMLGRARIWYEREAKSKLEVADAIKAKARLDDIAKIDVPAKDPAGLPLLSPVVVRRAYNTLGADVVGAEWRVDGGAAVRPDGIVLPAGNPAVHSRFGIASGGRLALTIHPDGREVRINSAGQEFAFAGTAKVMRIVIERDDSTVKVTAYPDAGDPVGRSADLPVLARGAMPVTIRVTGTASRPEGTLLTAAVARGPCSFPLPSAE